MTESLQNPNHSEQETDCIGHFDIEFRRESGEDISVFYRVRVKAPISDSDDSIAQRGVKKITDDIDEITRQDLELLDVCIDKIELDSFDIPSPLNFTTEGRYEYNGQTCIGYIFDVDRDPNTPPVVNVIPKEIDGEPTDETPIHNIPVTNITEVEPTESRE